MPELSSLAAQRDRRILQPRCSSRCYSALASFGEPYADLAAFYFLFSLPSRSIASQLSLHSHFRRLDHSQRWKRSPRPPALRRDLQPTFLKLRLILARPHEIRNYGHSTRLQHARNLPARFVPSFAGRNVVSSWPWSQFRFARRFLKNEFLLFAFRNS